MLGLGRMCRCGDCGRSVRIPSPAYSSGCAVVGSQAHAAQAAQAAYPPRVTPDVLTGRKYLVVRAIGDTPSESGREAQKRFVRTFYGAVEEWDP